MSTNNTENNNSNNNMIDNNNLARFLLMFLVGWIGCIVINHTSLKPAGWKCRTCAFLFLGILTFGIYSLVASISSLFFKSNADRNIGFFKVNY